MAAGDSAAEQARTLRRSALEHDDRAAEDRASAGRCEAAAETERRIVERLGRLVAHGFHILADRRWPGSRSANVDCVVIGPSGVFIVDPKCWADVSIGARRIVRGGVDVSAELQPLADLADLTRTALGEVGLPPREVTVLAVLAGWSDLGKVIGGVEVVGEGSLVSRIVSGGTRLRPDQVDVLVRACIDLFPAYPTSTSPGPVPTQSRGSAPPTVRPRPNPTDDLQPSDDPEPSDDLDALFSDQDLQDALLAGRLQAPIEEWMAFLHPDQARLVTRNLNGPSRIRGAAGTGKSVVGLHRAEWLARTRPGKVLVTSFVKTVPQVLAALYAEFAPETLDRVDFIGVHSLAHDLLRRRGIPARIDPDAADRAFKRAWSAVGVKGPLGRSRQPERYWADEVKRVIKGRGLNSLADYVRLRRVGRRYSLSGEQRVAVWELYEDYQARLGEAGILDFDDIIVRGEAIARQRSLPMYSSVIVDEVQDVSCVGLRMLHALVGDVPDGLLLIGDGQQAIYPGGFTLSEVGIDVRGRSTVLRRNYRNTVEILRAAQEVVAGDAFSDLEDREELGERDAVVIRHGEEPVREIAGSRAELDRLLLRAVERARGLPSVGLGDLAVLTPHNSEAERCRRLLDSKGIPVVALEDYAGRPIARIKVGTYHRAKGLDFKHVFLPHWNDPRRPEQEEEEGTEAAERERRELERRSLFVAMTRARDGLWLGAIRHGS